MSELTSSPIDTTTTTSAVRDADALKKELKALAEKRDVLEMETKSAMAYLLSTPVGLNGKLIDDEGFPRNDIDHYAVREARNKLACNRTDLGMLMEQMKQTLEELHDVTREETAKEMGNAVRLAGEARAPTTQRSAATKDANKEAAGEAAKVAPPPAPPKETPKAFLRVANVAPNSPAYSAGLRPGDHIHLFGEVDYDGFKANGLQLLGSFTRANEGQTVSILVSTPENSATLTVEHFIVPRRWAGPGLIGAEFDPIL